MLFNICINDLNDRQNAPAADLILNWDEWLIDWIGVLPSRETLKAGEMACQEHNIIQQGEMQSPAPEKEEQEQSQAAVLARTTVWKAVWQRKTWGSWCTLSWARVSSVLLQHTRKIMSLAVSGKHCDLAKGGALCSLRNSSYPVLWAMCFSSIFIQIGAVLRQTRVFTASS